MWSDSCASWAVGEPQAAHRRAHAAVTAALEIGLEVLGPNVTAGHVDGVVRAAVADAGYSYPHHTGHGVGFTAHELPRIIPESDTPLVSGMVVALEPGAYGDGFGVRVEHVAVITDDGCRRLSEHEV